MSHYPDSMTSHAFRAHFNEAPESDNTDLDRLCAEAEAKLAAFSVEQVAVTEDEEVRKIASQVDEAIYKMVDTTGYHEEADASFDYWEELATRHPKLHALLGSL